MRGTHSPFYESKVHSPAARLDRTNALIDILFCVSGAFGAMLGFATVCLELFLGAAAKRSIE